MSTAELLAIPPKTDARWRSLVSGTNSTPITVLALKFMLTRMAQDVHHDPSPATLDRNVDELHQFFVKNPRMVAADVAVLFG
jgi:hypothetical protein